MQTDGKLATAFIKKFSMKSKTETRELSTGNFFRFSSEAEQTRSVLFSCDDLETSRWALSKENFQFAFKSYGEVPFDLQTRRRIYGVVIILHKVSRFVRSTAARREGRVHCCVQSALPLSCCFISSLNLWWIFYLAKTAHERVNDDLHKFHTFAHTADKSRLASLRFRCLQSQVVSRRQDRLLAMFYLSLHTRLHQVGTCVESERGVRGVVVKQARKWRKIGFRHFPKETEAENKQNIWAVVSIY